MSNKKIVITGHTSGIGKFIYDALTKDSCREVIGMSRSNGYDLEKDFDRIVKESEGAEIFINNAYRDAQQLKLLKELHQKVGMMVVMGSISRFYPEIIPTQYVIDKQQLAEECRKISLQPNSIPILHLDLSFIENTSVDNDCPTSFISDDTITYKDILDVIIFWTQHSSVRQVEFRWRLTEHLKTELKRINPNANLSRIIYE